MSEFVISVRKLNEYVNNRLAGDAFLQDVWIEGEASEISRRRPDTAFFKLKDGDARVDCASFQFVSNRLDDVVQQGSRIRVRGRIGLYTKAGGFRINVLEARFAGKGDLQEQLLRLMKKLAAEGLFAEERKRPLPPYPKTIAVVTSGSGAARRDIEQIAARRNPAVNLRIYPVTVQGTTAPGSIVEALKQVMEDNTADIVILARGGGSADDLAAFNDERVVRAIAGCTIPTISAVGHETDVTLCDLAADRRASTPSAAAELAVPEAQTIRAEIRNLIASMQQSTRAVFEHYFMRVRAEQAELRSMGADHRVRLFHEQISRLLRDQESAVRAVQRRMDAELRAEERTLTALNPKRILTSGYAVVLKSGRRVASASEVHKGDTLQLVFKDGVVSVQVERSS